MSLFFSPREGVTMTNWSILDEVPTPNSVNGRSAYFVLHDYAVKPDDPVEIWLDLTVSILLMIVHSPPKDREL